MGARYRVNITAEALADLEQISSYISHNSPRNAAAFIERILDSVDALNILPTRHKIVGRSRRTGSRVHSMVVRPYIVYYRVEEGPGAVFILTVRHGRRKQPRHFD